MNDSVESIGPISCSFGEIQTNPSVIFYCVLYTVACALVFGLLFLSRFWAISRWLREWTRQPSTESYDLTQQRNNNTSDASRATP